MICPADTTAATTAAEELVSSLVVIIVDSDSVVAVEAVVKVAEIETAAKSGDA